MNEKFLLKAMGLVLCALTVTGCATVTPYDYTAFKESRPRSILVLPPINNTPEMQASYSVLSHATRPLAESGYYVMPVTLVAEAFRENGMTEPTDIHGASADKLRQIFGADAALYVTISKYGTVYQVIDSASIVTADAKLMDLRTGKVIWSGSATASSSEGENQQGGLAVLLISAIVKQVIGSTTDQSHRVASVTTTRLLSAGRTGGILFGQRSPNFGKD